MKRVLTMVLLMVVAFALYAGGNQEIEISMIGMHGGVYELALGAFARRHPDVKLRTLEADTRTGETITMDALVAAGTPPDIYMDFAGRAAKYKVLEFAQELTIDESVFVPELLDWGRIDGKLYGVPMPLPGQGMVLNLDILDAVGYKVPDRWTTADFLAMAAKVKAAGYIPTVLFAANPSGDYQWVNWFASFGAEFYAEGYGRSTLDTPAGLAAFRWLDTLVRRGYVPEGPQSITDDDALAIWQTGKVAALAMRPSWVDAYMLPAVKAGTIKEPFRVVMVPFPRDPSVERVKTIGAGNMIIVHKQTDATKLGMINELIMIMAGKESQSAIIINEGFPTRNDVPLVANNPYELLVRDIAKTAGWMNVGYSQPWYYEIRALLPEILRDMYAGKITPEQARDSFVARSNAILSK